MASAPIELVQRIPLFAGLDGKELKSLAGLLNDRVFDSGSTVVQEGRSGLGFFVIDSGTATVNVGGNEVRKLGPGDHFGEIALIADMPRTATITADTELVCYGMTVWDFRALVESNGTFAWKLLQATARMLVDAERSS